MEEEIQGLSERIERLLLIVGRLADENGKLRSELTESRAAQQEMQHRMSDARARVEAALSRLPILANDGE